MIQRAELGGKEVRWCQKTVKREAGNYFKTLKGISGG